MKFLKDYTGKELEDIAFEQVDNIINLECAEQGIPLLPPFPKESKKPDYKPDMVLHRVGGYGGWHTATAEEATTLLNALLSVNLWKTDYNNLSNDKKAKKCSDNDDYRSIVTEKVFSPELWGKISGELKAYSKAEEVSKSKLERYNNVEKDRKTIYDSVWKHVNNAKEFKDNRLMYEKHLADYVKLSDGDEKYGRKFFDKAYPSAGEYFGSYYTHSDLA